MNSSNPSIKSFIFGNSMTSSSSSPQDEMLNSINQNIILLNNFKKAILSNIQNLNKDDSKQFVRKRTNKSKFSLTEDQQLIDLVCKYGEHNWKKVSAEMDGRSIRQCRDRYRHYLSPKINQSSWTDEEDNLLIENVEKIGFRWKLLEKFFTYRNEIQIRNRYYQITHNVSRKCENNEESEQNIGNINSREPNDTNYYDNNIELKKNENHSSSFLDKESYFNGSDSFYSDEYDVDSDCFFFPFVD